MHESEVNSDSNIQIIKKLENKRKKNIVMRHEKMFVMFVKFALYRFLKWEFSLNIVECAENVYECCTADTSAPN